MKTLYICNAFSLSMLNRNYVYTPLPIDDPKEIINSWKAYPSTAQIVSAIGHADTAALFSSILGIPLQQNRVSIKLTPNDNAALIGQYIGPRLPEGSTTLPEGATIEWWIIPA